MAGLLETGVMFAALAVAGAVAARVGLSVVPAYVVLGVAAGPHGLGALGLLHVPDDPVVDLLAELGVVLLLFFLGLEFSLDRLLARGRTLGLAGGVDLALNFPLGVTLGLAFGWSLVEASLLGGVVYVSSSAVITKSLVDLGWIANPESEPILGVLVFEDLFVAVYLAVASALVLGGGDVGGAARDVVVALAFLVALLVAVRFGTPAFDRYLRVGSAEAFVLRLLAVAVPVAGFALAIGVSDAVAAFFVGMGFSVTDHVERIERTLSPVRDVFAAVFFFAVGLGTDPRLVATVAVPLAAVVLATGPAKVLGGLRVGRLYGLSRRRSLRVGTGLVARGEFSLVIAALAAQGATPVLRETLPALAVGYVLVMSALGTLAMEFTGRFESRLADGDEAVRAGGNR